MQVVIQPAHGVLNGNVKVPEGVLLGNQDAAPDERVRSRENNQELMHERWLRPRHFRSSPGFQISSRSRPRTTLPSNRDRAASIHIWSVICGSSAGTRWESTSVFTPAACAIRPASSADV